MRPTILCADAQQAVTAIFAVGIRLPGRVWIELEWDRCRKIVYLFVCYGVRRPWHRRAAAHWVYIDFSTIGALRKNTLTPRQIIDTFVRAGSPAVLIPHRCIYRGKEWPVP